MAAVCGRRVVAVASRVGRMRPVPLVAAPKRMVGTFLDSRRVALGRAFSSGGNDTTWSADVEIEGYKGDHEDRTADSPRSDTVASAVVTRVRDLSPTVKGLTLEVSNEAFTFHPGQWVDMFIPSIDVIGGFSIASTPAQLPNVELAVKQPARPHAPALWVHNDAAVGSEVMVRVGGRCFYDIRKDDQRQRRHVVFVAGGIGITGLKAMVDDFIEWAGTEEGAASDATATFLYSAVSPEELVFSDELQSRVRSITGKMQLHFVFSGVDRPSGEILPTNFDHPSELADLHMTRRQGWIDPGLLHAALQPSSHGSSDSRTMVDHTLCIVCGPPPMTEYVVEQCATAGLPEASIRYERWW